MGLEDLRSHGVLKMLVININLSTIIYFLNDRSYVYIIQNSAGNVLLAILECT